MSVADYLILQGIMGRQLSLAKTIESNADFLVDWPMQELTGAVAGATNIAVDLGRELVVNGGPFTFTADDIDNWTEINESAPNRLVTECGSGEDRTGAGTGSVCLYSDSGTQVQIRQGNLEASRTYRITTVCSFFNDLGGGEVTLKGASSAAGTTLRITGVDTFQMVITVPTAGAFRVQVANAEATFDSIVLEQTDIAASTAFSTPGDNPLDGTHTGIDRTTGNQQVPVMVEYGGAGDLTNVSSAEFNSMLDPTEFALSIIVQKSTWDAAERYFFSHTVDADNWIRCGGTATAGQLLWEVRAGGTTEQILLASGSPTDIFHMGIQVKSGVMSAIYRGVIIDTESVAGTFVGNFATMIIGAKNDTPTNVMLGKLAYHVHSTDKSASQWLREARAAGAV